MELLHEREEKIFGVVGKKCYLSHNFFELLNEKTRKIIKNDIFIKKNDKLFVGIKKSVYICIVILNTIFLPLKS